MVACGAPCRRSCDRPGDADGGDRLPPEAATGLDAAATAAGLNWPPGDEPRTALQAVRASYEPLLGGLAGFLMHDLPGWLPADDAEDHWTRGHRGLLARTVVAHLSEPDATAPGAWRRIRARLK